MSKICVEIASRDKRQKVPLAIRLDGVLAPKTASFLPLLILHPPTWLQNDTLRWI